MNKRRQPDPLEACKKALFEGNKGVAVAIMETVAEHPSIARDKAALADVKLIDMIVAGLERKDQIILTLIDLLVGARR